MRNHRRTRMMGMSERSQSTARDIEDSVDGISEEVDMISSNPYRSWSLRPDELLIGSARERLTARAGFDYAESAHDKPETAGAAVRASMGAMLAELGRRVSPRRRLGAAATAIPEPERFRSHDSRIALRFR